MNDAGLVARQVRYEMRAFWRNPASAIFTFLFPLMFLVIFATLNSGARITERGDLPFVQFFVPGILAFGVISACFVNLAIRTTILRDVGVLKRVRGTPVPRWAYLAGHVGTSLAISVVLVTVTTVVGVVLYGVEYRGGTTVALLVGLLVGAACFCALGLAITAVVPNADAAPAVVNGAVFPLVFVSGIFFPLDNAPGWLKTVAKVFPVQRLANALQVAFDPRTRGLGFNAGDLVVLALWGAAGAIIAVRFFRWTD